MEQSLRGTERPTMHLRAVRDKTRERSMAMEQKRSLEAIANYEKLSKPQKENQQTKEISNGLKRKREGDEPQVDLGLLKQQ